VRALARRSAKRLGRNLVAPPFLAASPAQPYCDLPCGHVLTCDGKHGNTRGNCCNGLCRPCARCVTMLLRSLHCGAFPRNTGEVLKRGSSGRHNRTSTVTMTRPKLTRPGRSLRIRWTLVVANLHRWLGHPPNHRPDRITVPGKFSSCSVNGARSSVHMRCCRKRLRRPQENAREQAMR